MGYRRDIAKGVPVFVLMGEDLIYCQIYRENSLWILFHCEVNILDAIFFLFIRAVMII